MERKFYVYVWIREDNNSVFYVGKGNGKRAGNTSMRNQHFKRIIAKTSCHYEIIYENLTEGEAFELEVQTIKNYLDLGYGIDIRGYEKTSEYYLVNSTLGGDGTSGYKHEEGAKSGEKKIVFMVKHIPKKQEKKLDNNI